MRLWDKGDPDISPYPLREWKKRYSSFATHSDATRIPRIAMVYNELHLLHGGDLDQFTASFLADDGTPRCWSSLVVAVRNRQISEGRRRGRKSPHAA